MTAATAVVPPTTALTWPRAEAFSSTLAARPLSTASGPCTMTATLIPIPFWSTVSAEGAISFRKGSAKLFLDLFPSRFQLLGLLGVEEE